MIPLMRRRLIAVLLGVGALIVIVAGLKFYFISQAIAASKVPPPPAVVTTVTAAYSDWQPEVAAVASLRAARGVDLSFELPGLVRSIRFHSGDQVTAGQVLIELNADTDVAQLHALQAAAELAQTAYTRDKIQLEAQAISQAQLDADAADLKSRRAQAESQAALLAKKTLRAPFAGRLGITMVNPGQYVNPGDKMVTLQQLDPIYVDFKLPQQELARVQVGQALTVLVDAFPQQRFTGTLTALDPRVDAATRNFQAEGLMENHDGRLLPGMFARVAVAAGAAQRFLTLPQTAITYNPYGATVFLARPGAGGGPMTVQQTIVTLGATRGDQVAVLSGIRPGDIVVTSGQLKLKNGTAITADNRLPPANDPHPSPQEQ